LNPKELLPWDTDATFEVVGVDLAKILIYASD
jgi:hypothetical protein